MNEKTIKSISNAKTWNELLSITKQANISMTSQGIYPPSEAIKSLISNMLQSELAGLFTDSFSKELQNIVNAATAKTDPDKGLLFLSEKTSDKELSNVKLIDLSEAKEQIIQRQKKLENLLAFFGQNI